MIGGLLRLLSEAVRAHILRRAGEVGYTDISSAHLAVFQFPSPEGATPSDLAARAGISKQSMNYLLGELEDRGYLTRRPTPGDKRSRVVLLSSRGRHLVEAMQDAVRQIEVRWTGLLGAGRYEQMHLALTDLFHQLGSDVEEAS
jgi:DNA-binding MarR family transcriptional regulator